MSNQRQAAEGQHRNQNQQNDKPAPITEPIGDQVSLVRLPRGFIGAADDSSIGVQAAYLSNRRFQTIQRQALAAQLGRVGGNRYLQRVIAQMDQESPSVETDDGSAVPLNGGAASGAAAPKPTFDHSGGQTVTINADTAPEFAQNITAAIGTPHVQPVYEPDIQVDFKTNAAGEEVPGTRKIISIGLKVTTSITKVRFGLGRPNPQHKKAIDEMVAAIKAHEEAHRALIEAEATTALAAAQKFVGTGKTAEAEKALKKDLECATNKKHEALDATEGLLTAAEQQDGSVTVTKSGSGAKYPCS
jgi:hypothetical protein